MFINHFIINLNLIKDEVSNNYSENHHFLIKTTAYSLLRSNFFLLFTNTIVV